MTSEKVKGVFAEVCLRERGTGRGLLFDPVFMCSFAVHRAIHDILHLISCFGM